MSEATKRDELAKQRTELANSRTLMSFVRTALMLFATGITFIKLFAKDEALVFIGKILIPVAGLLLLYGIFYFVRSKNKIRNET
jgi:putative membrane protein